MAQTPITHQCGHTTTHQLYGPHAERDQRASRLAEESCPECRQTAADQRNADAAAAAAADGWPALAGSPKQVGWAETIRRDLITSMGATVRKSAPAGATAAQADAVVELYTEIALRQTAASWWIDRRDSDLTRALYSIATAEDRARVADIRSAITQS
jgi:hypothetical protein